MKIDHFGIVVNNINESATVYLKLFRFKKKTGIILDKIQQVYIQFFQYKNEVIELVQPINQNSPSYNALLKGGGANHICFQTYNIQKELTNLRKDNCIIVCLPVAGAGFKKRLVAFVVHPLLGLVELVEYLK